MIQAAGEDGVDDLHHNKHDVNEVGRLGAHSLLVNDAMHIVYGLSGGLRVIAMLIIAEQGGGPNARPSGAGGCPPIFYCMCIGHRP